MRRNVLGLLKMNTHSESVNTEMEIRSNWSKKLRIVQIKAVILV